MIKLPFLIYLTPFKLNEAKFRIPKKLVQNSFQKKISAMNIKMFAFSLVLIAKQWRLCYVMPNREIGICNEWTSDERKKNK